ncbi:hypothetical protein TNIN_380391 [Trichonephila inaurata madagascariensis]|uniref:TAZ-type domain-containing protein n=1 Tax=Trichonephila inaurata madagascariensis TaxID=2747483 RepID=A0A8X6X5C1_9ARAC|nr:hypothetical protein TNIN_380391 [Trichonephila inaurata madagascariensis]
MCIHLVDQKFVSGNRSTRNTFRKKDQFRLRPSNTSLACNENFTSTSSLKKSTAHPNETSNTGDNYGFLFSNKINQVPCYNKDTYRCGNLRNELGINLSHSDIGKNPKDCYGFEDQKSDLEKNREGLAIPDQMDEDKSSPPKKGFILDYFLEHASWCGNSECHTVACRRIKRSFQHFLKCDLLNNCERFREVTIGVVHHRKCCKVEKCPVFLCDILKKVQSDISRPDQECMEDSIEDGPLDTTDKLDSKPLDSEHATPRPFLAYTPRPLTERKLFCYYIEIQRSRRKAELDITQEASSSNLDIQHDDPCASTPL